MALPQTAELTIGSGQWWTSPNARSVVTATAISDGTTIKCDVLSEGPALIRSFVTTPPSPDSLAKVRWTSTKGSDPLTDTFQDTDAKDTASKGWIAAIELV